MSFPKAKIHRFNETQSQAPSPGKYDPRLPERKGKGVVLERSSRFKEQQPLSASRESLDSNCSRCSHHQQQHCSAVKAFRTPQMPKKRVFATPRSAVSCKSSQKTPSICRSKKKLDYLTSDNENKENELNREIDELSSNSIGKGQESLLGEISDLKNCMAEMENTNDILLNNLRSEFETSINILTSELEKSRLELENEKEIHQKNLGNLKSQIKMLEENIQNCNAMNNELENQLLEKQNAMLEMMNQHSDVEAELKKAKDLIDKMLKDHASEIQNLKQRSVDELEGLATAAELNVDLLARKMEDRLKIIEKQVEIEKEESQKVFNAKLDEISVMVKEKTKLFDSQVVEIFSKLAMMEQDFDQRASELVTTINICTDWNESKLQEHIRTLDALEAQKAANLEQKIIILDLQEKVELLEEEIVKLKKQSNKYEVIQNEATKTIQVLSQRLFESESEVERQNEIRKEMRLRSKALEEKVRSLIHENNQLTSNLNEIRVAIVKEVKEVESVLLGKVESYRKKAAEESKRFRVAIEERQNQIELTMQELEFYRVKAIETADYISHCQSRMTAYKDEVKALTKKYNDFETQHNRKMTEQKKLYSSLNDKYEKMCNEFNSERKMFLSKLEILEKEKQRLEQLVRGKTDEINNLEVALKEAEHTLEETKSKLQENERETAILEETVFEHERHIEDLASKLGHYTDCAQKTGQQVQALTKAKEELEKEIKKLEDDINEKDLKVGSLSVELNESKVYLQSVTEHFVTLMNEISEKDSRHEALLQEMEIKNVNMIQVSEEYEKMKDLYETELQKVLDLEKEMKEMQRDNEKYVDELISELVLEKERGNEIAGNLEEAKSKIGEYVTKIRELEEQTGNSNKCEEMQNKIKILESSLSETKMENVDLSCEVDALYKEIEELEKQIEEHKKDKKKMAGVVNELRAEKTDLMEMVRHQRQDLELVTSEVNRQQEMIEELREGKRESREEERAEWEAELAEELRAAQQEAEEREREIRQLRAREEELVFKLAAAERDLAEGEAERGVLAAKAKEAADKLADYITKYTGMEKRKNDYKHRVVALENQLMSSKEEIAALQDDKEKLKELYDEEAMKTAGMCARIADLECRERELEGIIGPFRQQLTEYEAERAELLRQASTTQEELRQVELRHAKALGHQNHRQKIKHVVHLTEQINHLKAEVEKLRLENSKLRVTALEGGVVSGKARSASRKDKENAELSPARSKLSVGSAAPPAPKLSSPALKERNNAH